MRDSSAERRPQRADQSSSTKPTNHPTTAAIVIRALATMPAALQSFEPAGSGPNTNQPGVMNFQSTINPLASSDVGGTAGHVAAACVSASGECDCERVRDARDASCILPPTTLSPRARQVVVPQAQNSGTSAAAIALVPQPSTIENAGADAPEVSTPERSVHFATDPPSDDEEGWTKVEGETARGRAKRSAKCGTSVPSVPSAVRRPTRSSSRPTASVAPFDAVAPPVTPSVASAASPLPPWGGVAYDRNRTPTHPSIRVSLPPFPVHSLPRPALLLSTLSLPPSLPLPQPPYADGRLLLRTTRPSRSRRELLRSILRTTLPSRSRRELLSSVSTRSRPSPRLGLSSLADLVSSHLV